MTDNSATTDRQEPNAVDPSLYYPTGSENPFLREADVRIAIFNPNTCSILTTDLGLLERFAEELDHLRQHGVIRNGLKTFLLSEHLKFKRWEIVFFYDHVMGNLSFYNLFRPIEKERIPFSYNELQTYELAVRTGEDFAGRMDSAECLRAYSQFAEAVITTLPSYKWHSIEESNVLLGSEYDPAKLRSIIRDIYGNGDHTDRYIRYARRPEWARPGFILHENLFPILRQRYDFNLNPVLREVPVLTNDDETRITYLELAKRMGLDSEMIQNKLDHELYKPADEVIFEADNVEYTRGEVFAEFRHKFSPHKPLVYPLNLPQTSEYLFSILPPLLTKAEKLQWWTAGYIWANLSTTRKARIDNQTVEVERFLRMIAGISGSGAEKDLKGYEEIVEVSTYYEEGQPHHMVSFSGIMAEANDIARYYRMPHKEIFVFGNKDYAAAIREAVIQKVARDDHIPDEISRPQRGNRYRGREG